MIDIAQPELYETSLSFFYEEPPLIDDAPDLVGTTWRAIEIANNEPIRPISLTFDEDFISGESGCNNYRASVELLSGSLFTVGNAFSKTKMYCLGVMDQERDYINFLEGNTFYYEVTSGIDNIELLLYDASIEEDHNILARFAKA